MSSIPRRSRKTGTIQGVWNKERKYRNARSQVRGLMDRDCQGFVNAQYRFVMNPMGDYTVHFADPDMYVTLFEREAHCSYPVHV